MVRAADGIHLMPAAHAQRRAGDLAKASPTSSTRAPSGGAIIHTSLCPPPCELEGKEPIAAHGRGCQRRPRRQKRDEEGDRRACRPRPRPCKGGRLACRRSRDVRLAPAAASVKSGHVDARSAPPAARHRVRRGVGGEPIGRHAVRADIMDFLNPSVRPVCQTRPGRKSEARPAARVGSLLQR